MSERLTPAIVTELFPHELMNEVRQLQGLGRLNALSLETVQAINARWWKYASGLNPDSNIYTPNILELRRGNWQGAMVPTDFIYLTGTNRFSHGDVLWLGAGIGVDGAIPLAGWKKKNGSGHVVAADVSHTAMEFAKTLVDGLGIPNTTFSTVAAGIHHLPLPEGQFDAAVMTGGVLQYLPSLGEAARQVYRVLNKGGVLYWRDNGPDVPNEPITLVDLPPIVGEGYYGSSSAHHNDKKARQLLTQLYQLPVIRFRYSPTTVEGELRGAGFANVRVETQDFLGYQREGMVRSADGVFRYPPSSPYATQPLSFILTAEK